MRIDLRDTHRRRIGRIEVDPSERPTRVTIEGDGDGDASREVFLQWETALDDAGQLRRCIACGCPDLFRQKPLPQVTPLVIVLAFAGAFAGILGYVTNWPLLIGMIIVLVLDVAILLFPRTRLVCYRCASAFQVSAIARYHRSWDRSLAERHPPDDERSEPRGTST